jgi:hypothetical protein
MKAFLKLASVLVWAFSLNAQITAVLDRFPARSPEIVIRNNSEVNLTAFAVSMAPVAQSPADSASFVVYVDTAVDTDRLAVSYRLNAAMPLAPSQEYAVPVIARFQDGRWVDLFRPPIATAAVFVDGTIAGDPALLARLMSRRGNMLQAVELASNILKDAGRHNVSRGQLIEQFKKLADSLNHWYLAPEQQVGRTLYQSIAEKLMNLPPLQVGSAFPPTAFVDQETAILNRQRTRLLESPPGLNLAAAVPAQR